MKQATPTTVVFVCAALAILSGANSFAASTGSLGLNEFAMDLEFTPGSGPELSADWAPNATKEQDSELISTRSARSGIPENCQWSACQGLTVLGQVICRSHGAGFYYVGYTKKDDCKWDSSRSECCKAGSNKRWTKKCWGSGYQSVYACQKEFGHGVVPTGTTKKCSGIAMTQYECGN